MIRHLRASDPLHFHPVGEAQIRHEDVDPVERAQNRDEIDEVSEDGGCGLGHIHVGQEAED